MKIVIAAGTGFLGEILVNRFKKDYQEIIVLTRGKEKKTGNIKYVHWNAKSLTGWEIQLENAHVLINLTGKSVDCIYNEKNKAEIVSSRVNSTKLLNKLTLSLLTATSCLL